MDHFIDLGAGWFLYDDESSRLTVVCSFETQHILFTTTLEG